MKLIYYKRLKIKLLKIIQFSNNLNFNKMNLFNYKKINK